MDVSKQDNIIKSLDEIIKHYSQPPSIVVNSAGILDDSFLLNMSLEQFESVINVNLKVIFSVKIDYLRELINTGEVGSENNINSEMSGK